MVKDLIILHKQEVYLIQIVVLHKRATAQTTHSSTSYVQHQSIADNSTVVQNTVVNNNQQVSMNNDLNVLIQSTNTSINNQTQELAKTNEYLKTTIGA